MVNRVSGMSSLSMVSQHKSVLSLRRCACFVLLFISEAYVRATQVPFE